VGRAEAEGEGAVGDGGEAGDLKEVPPVEGAGQGGQERRLRERLLPSTRQPLRHDDFLAPVPPL